MKANMTMAKMTKMKVRKLMSVDLSRRVDMKIINEMMMMTDSNWNKHKHL